MIKQKHKHKGKIKIHWDHPGMDVSLCGMAMEGDDPYGDGSDLWTPMIPTEKGKVNCEDCLIIVAHVKGR